MKILLCTGFILISLLTTGVNCQNDSGDSWWRGMMENINRMAEKVSSFVQTSMEQLQRVWAALEKEIKATIKDLRGWTEETWRSFKDKWLETVDERDDISEADKKDMREFIERMQMPEEAESE